MVWKLIISLLLGAVMTASLSANTCRTDELTLDHVIYVAPNLKAAAQHVENLTGVKPVYGGVHTNGVTANYLVALGPCLYMEIVGPKDGLTLEDFGEPRRSTYRNAHVAGFALRLKLDKSLLQLSEETGLALGPSLNEGGRMKPDGSRLVWRTTGLPEVKLGPGTFQFVIEWLEGEHPSVSAAKGIRLKDLYLEGLQGEIATKLDSLDNIQVMEGHKNLKLLLETPNGEIVLE